MTSLDSRTSSAVAEECWAESDLVELRCCQVQEITHDVKSFVFAAPQGRYFEFDAGQFVTLQLEIDGVALTRCYTVSSPPTRPLRLSITVKRVPGGPVSNWLHDNLVPGSTVPVLAPLGSFTLPAEAVVHELTAEKPPKFLFLSAGSGITPLMSMTRTMADLGSSADVVFVHSARTPADIIFRRELDAIESVVPNVRVVHVCENDYPADRWPGLRGRLSTSMLETLVPDLAERRTFVCGPAPYMASVRRLLEARDYDFSRYHEESFNFDRLPATDVRATIEEAGLGSADVCGGAVQEAPAGFSVEFARSGRTITCGADEHILDAAFAAGMRPPSSCSQGMCGTCKTVKLSGEVEMQHNGGIRPKEIAQNKILICCSKPLSDLRLDA